MVLADCGTRSILIRMNVNVETRLASTLAQISFFAFIIAAPGGASAQTIKPTGELFDEFHTPSLAECDKSRKKTHIDPQSCYAIRSGDLGFLRACARLNESSR